MTLKIIANKYEILAELGRGGMGRVYKVRHRELNKIYALKLLREHLVEDDNQVARFHSEARIMANLRQDHIVQVFDIDRAGDQHFFVMEYIEGKTLADLIKEQAPLPVADVLSISRQIAQALAYAHQQQPMIIHRDIKPSNIMIESGSGRVVVTDFGIAKLLDADSTRQTLSGLAVGTPSYAAPEQLGTTDDLDGRADIFSLGLVMYEMLAGRPFFENLTPQQIIGKKLYDTQEFTPTFDTFVAAPLQRIIHRAIAKNRDQRYPAIAALLDALDRFEQNETKPAPIPSRSRRWPFRVAVITVLVLAGYLAWPFVAAHLTDRVPASAITLLDSTAHKLPVSQQNPATDDTDPVNTSTASTAHSQPATPNILPPAPAVEKPSGKGPILEVSPATVELAIGICSRQNFSVNNAAAFSTFQWSVNDEPQPDISPQFTFTPPEPGHYAVRLQAVAEQHTSEHNWQVQVTADPLAKSEVNAWLARYQETMQSRDIAALQAMGDLFTAAELSQLSGRQRYQITLSNWDISMRDGDANLSFSQLERWYNPETSTPMVERTSHALILSRQGCHTVSASRSKLVAR